MDEYDKFIEEFISKNKYLWFVQHLQAHLEPNEKVFCRICGKTIDECAKEELERMTNFVKDKL